MDGWDTWVQALLGHHHVTAGRSVRSTGMKRRRPNFHQTLGRGTSRGHAISSPTYLPDLGFFVSSEFGSV